MNKKQGPKIVVIGSSNTDMVVRTPHVPAPGETILGGDMLMISGGKGANQAVAAARLGGDVTFVARIGNDLFGDKALSGIEADGVRTQYITRDPHRPSGVALICVGDDGQNSIVVASGANSCLSASDVDAAHSSIEACAVVVLQFESPDETVLHAATIANKLGKIVLLNPAPARPVGPELLGKVDVLTPNEIEAAMLLGRAKIEPGDEASAARELMSLGPKAVVITLGAIGVVVADRDGIEHIPAPLVEAVDTTAAGDCFTGALAVGLGEGMVLREAARFAVAAASISVTRLGAQSSMPKRSEIEGTV